MVLFLSKLLDMEVILDDIIKRLWKNFNQKELDKEGTLAFTRVCLSKLAKE